MKKLLFLLFVLPVVAYAECTQPLTGSEFEYSECKFIAQNLSDSVKSFWGKPKITNTEPISDNNGAGSFIIREAWQCGRCVKDDSCPVADDTCKWKKNTQNIFKSTCGTDETADDEVVLAYVASDVSAHGAEFCLTQFTAASWDHPQFFVYMQVSKVTNKLSCQWFCEPGWDGDRCETKGLPESAPNGNSIVEDKDYISSLPRPDAFNEPYCGDCSPATNKITVLDYKKVGKRMQGWGSESNSFPQFIVIGATDFMAHGIKARPMLIGANGGHHMCYDWQNTKKTMYANMNIRKYLRNPTDFYARAADGGKERVLCVQGYTLNENCDKSYTGGTDGLSECTHEWYKVDFSQIPFDSKKHYKKYYAAGKCIIYQCLNGMNLSSDDKYACTVCKDSPGGIQGLCPATNKCVWCGAGKCLNKTTCKCDACSAVLTMEQMRLGQNKLDQCWEIIDADEFKACVMAGSTTGGSE